MKSQEILESLTPDLIEEIFSSIHALDKASYRSLIQSLATRKKLRPVYLERKPRIERHLWMRDQLVWSSNRDLSDQVLQIWLLSACQPMICDFLDKLKIPHDGQGIVDVLPKEPDASLVQKTVKSLLETYPPIQVAVYLQFFADMADTPWEELQKLLTTNEQLRLHKTEPSLP
ncbi:MAG: hypothetical protein ABI443_05720 [Chthoniobacterales bacterium]